MKKFLKFVAVVTSATVAVLGVLYVWKKYFIKDEDNDVFDEFDNDFEDDFEDDFDAEVDSREYVTLTMPEEGEASTDTEKEEEKEA